MEELNIDSWLWVGETDENLDALTEELRQVCGTNAVNSFLDDILDQDPNVGSEQ